MWKLIKRNVEQSLNLFLSAAAFNLCKWMRAKAHLLDYFLFLVFLSYFGIKR